MSRSRSTFWRNLSFLTIAPLLSALLFVQSQAKQPPPEEKVDPKKKPPPEETGGTTPTKPIRIDDPRDPAPPPVVTGNVDLASLKPDHENTRRLFKELAVAQDVVETGGNELIAATTTAIQPLPNFLELLPRNAVVKLIPINKKNKEWSSPASSVKKVTYYEDSVITAVDSFQKLSQPEPLKRLLAAEQALAAAAHVHTTLRKGDGWTTLGNSLRAKRLSVALERLHLLAANNDWPTVVALATQTVKGFPAGDHKTIADSLGALASKLLETGDEAKRKDAYRRLRQIEEALPNNEATKTIRDKLIAEADPFVQRADRFRKDNKITEAQAEVRKAEEIYPYHPGLRSLRSDVDNRFPILRVGTKELPYYLSPALAFSDIEKQAMEMLFEGLYELAPEPDGGRFRPALAMNRPRLIASGREMSLPRDAMWSNGTPIISNDIQGTIALLKHPTFPGRVWAWTDELIEGVSIKDDKHFNVTFRQGYLDPNALLSFKILPSKSGLRRPDDQDFARAPVGSGPFQYEPNGDAYDRREEDRFTANTYYRNRPGRSGKPLLREVKFFKTANPAQALRDGKVDLLLDVPAAEVAALRSARDIKVSAPLPSRRVYILAVNNRRPGLDNALLRKALAHAIPREELLNQFFRKGVPGVHHALNGPYPDKTWACDPKVRIDVRTSPVAKPSATFRPKLCYPAGDPAVEGAVKAMAKHIKDRTEIDVDVDSVGLKPQELREKVEKRDYDLAYYWYDYPDATFWLWPLLDARGNPDNIGKNFCNFDSTTSRLSELCQNALQHRNFDEVRTLTHFIHRVFVEKDMPFVPLWHLDRHIAWSSVVRMRDGDEDIRLDTSAANIDPLRIFGTIDSWEVKR